VLSDGIPRLPDDALGHFRSGGRDGAGVRLAFIEKIRHGPFLGLTGTMPPYAVEQLADTDLGALLVLFGLY
jgi:thiosulfate dehydrogenase